MNRKRSRFAQVMVVSVVLIGLLVAAWPGVAHGENPQPYTAARQLFQQRMREPQNFTQLAHGMADQSSTSESRSSWDPIQPSNDFSVMQWSTFAFARYVDLNTDNTEIFTVQDSGVFTQRTFNSAYDSMPRLNRSASRLTFISDRTGNNEIYAMNLDGSQLARLTTTSAHEYWPNWSPDGRKIVI